MDGDALSEDTERQIHELMTDWGLTRDEAMVAVGLAPGYPVGGDGDLVCVRPLAEEQRKRLGLGRDFSEILAEQYAQQARDAAPPNGQPP